MEEGYGSTKVVSDAMYQIEQKLCQKYEARTDKILRSRASRTQNGAGDRKINALVYHGDVTTLHRNLL